MKNLALFLLLAIVGCQAKSDPPTAMQPAESQPVPQSEQQSDARGYIVQVGDEAPDATLKLTDGSTVSLRHLRGKVVMLQFTASWCSVCREEMPHIQTEIWAANKDRDLLVFGVDLDEPLDTVVEFAAQTGVTYPLSLDPNGEIFSKFAAKESGVTRNVLIDRQGKIVFLTRLFEPDEFAALKDKIDSLL